MKYLNILLFASLISCNRSTEIPLTIVIQNTPPSNNIAASYSKSDHGKGNTSLAHDDSNIFKWSGDSPYAHETWGYFDQTGAEIPYIKRDRDLGQTFFFDSEIPKILKSITVRTGFGTNVVRRGMYGQKISIQLFEVIGSPVLNNNGSDSHTEAFHGFPHNRTGDSINTNRDDYFDGEIYQPLKVIRGASFPKPTDFGFLTNDTVPLPEDLNLKGKYLRFLISSDSSILLQPKKQYAFLFMIDEVGAERGFALANNYYGNFEGGHGIRRDGNGIFPPVPANPQLDFIHEKNKEALKAAHFPENFAERIKISPGTNGYPDVCTWRDLEFYIEAE